MSIAPPVSKDGFAYAIESFYAEAGNQSLHRRATIAELNTLFHPSGTASHTAEKDPVGHWYEAQLKHYGLTPSKTKAVAKTRLLDALNRGVLTVPPQVRKLEEQLKKEWLKKAKDTKKAGSTATATKATSSAPSAKRKRDAQTGPNVTVSVNVGVSSPAPSAPAKRLKQTAPRGSLSGRAKKSETAQSQKPTAAKPKASTSTPSRGGPSVRGRASNRAGRASRGGTVRADIKREETSPPPRTKQTARRGSSVRGRASNRASQASGGGMVRADIKPEEATPPPPPPPRTKQTARRSGGWLQARPPPIEHEEDSASELGYHSKDEYSDDDQEDLHQSDEPDYSGFDERELGPLGLINGKYKIRSAALDEWPDMFDEENFNLILCLEGNAIWGAYDFGMHTGIMHFPRRPMRSSYDRVPFSWRGTDNGEGEISFGPGNDGWIQFLGDGRIEGMIDCYGEAIFTGERISGDATRAPRSAASMRDEWDSYNEEAYEEARVNRWR